MNIFSGKPLLSRDSRYDISPKSNRGHHQYRLRIDSFYQPNILEGLEKTKFDMPIIQPNLAIPDSVMTTPFDRISHKNPSYDSLVIFYVNDTRFLPALSHPWDYTETLLKYKGVIGPDLSQYIDMDSSVRQYHNYWNKVLTAAWQRNGINIYPNVTWSLPDSYEYALAGLPRHSVVAINSIGVLKYHFTKGLWLKGYKYMVEALDPILILRYGPKVEGEYEEISRYLPNVQLNILRNGSKRK